MDRSTALGELPTGYARVLRLSDAGLSPAEVARRLDLDLDVIETMLLLARAKLSRLMDQAATGE